MIDTKNFARGPVVKVHKIGDIEIVEHHPRIYKSSAGTKNYDYTKTQFHPYVTGLDTNTGHDSLDAALICAIAIKHDGINTRAHIYFKRMIEMCDETI